MKKINFFAILLLSALMFSSCEMVEGIFKAGMIWGIFLVVLVVVLIIWIIRKAKS